MKISLVLLVLAAVVTLPLWGPAAGFSAAIAAMWIGGLSNMKPDRSMEFNIEIDVSPHGTLVFKGETECINEAMIHGSAYRTLNDKIETKVNGITWILQGIDCERMSRPELNANYTVYEKTTQSTAIVRYLGENSKQIVRDDYKWGSHIGFGGTLPKQHQNVRYATGPFAYQKFMLSLVPSQLADIHHVTQIFFNAVEGCKGNADSPIRSRKIEYSELQVMVKASTTIPQEVGALEYDELNQTWIIGNGPIEAQALEAVHTKGWEYANPLSWPSCIEISTPEGKVMISSQHDWIFLPQSNTLIRATLLTRKSYLESTIQKSARALWWN